MNVSSAKAGRTSRSLTSRACHSRINPLPYPRPPKERRYQRNRRETGRSCEPLIEESHSASKTSLLGCKGLRALFANATGIVKTRGALYQSRAESCWIKIPTQECNIAPQIYCSPPDELGDGTKKKGADTEAHDEERDCQDGNFVRDPERVLDTGVR